tara:strand:+ start:187101 stop:187472 length:372 start_codon:yes stop_codon:yes gene_type:complete
MNKNIFGEPLITCSISPMTGFFRNGCCDTDKTDIGMHTICVIVTKEFLLFSKAVGNDLLTPMPEYGFDGLKEGDRWCLCALRWKEALINNVAPKVVLEATNEKTLNVIDIKDLIKYSHKELKK